MREIDGFFDELFFTECVLGVAEVHDGDLSIPVQGLFVLGGHPLATERAGPYQGELVFVGAVESRRRLIEYIGDPRKPNGFKPPREELEPRVGGDAKDEMLQEFGLEGYLETPSAWVDDWIIRARSFRLRLP
jgi:hypothetical protein